MKIKTMKRVIILIAIAMVVIIYMLFGDMIVELPFAIKAVIFIIYAILVGLAVKCIDRKEF